MEQHPTLSLEHRDEESQQWSHLTRRRFLKGTVLGGLGATLFGSASVTLAKAFLAGKTAADIRGAGVSPGIVKLDQNENPLGPSPKAIQAIQQHLHELNRYLGSYPFELVFKLNRLAGVNVDDLKPNPNTREEWDAFWKRNAIFLADGSGNILRAAAFTYLENGGHVIEAEGGYGDVSEFAQDPQRKGRNVTITRVPLTPEKRHDLEAMRKAITPETKLVVITNPNNPTGTLVSHEALEQFVNSVPETVKVLIDEAYIDFVRDPNYRNAAGLALARPNVLVTRTFSKVYGLPAIRMGYAISHQSNVEGFWNYTGSWNTLTLVAANAALDDAEHIRKSKQAIWDGREYLARELKAMNLSCTPTESNFMVIEVKDPKTVAQRLAQQKVFVRDADRRWGIKSHIRVSVGTLEENEVFINTLRQVLSQIGA